MLMSKVKLSVFPICENQAESKSLKEPLKNGKNPKNSCFEPSSFVSVKSKLMMSTITPMLMNCMIVSLIN